MTNRDLTLSHNDLIENPTPRCACALVLDTSASMDGSPIDELNAALAKFIEELKADDFASYAVEVCVTTFGGTVSDALALTTAHKIASIKPLSAYGDTPMGQAVMHAIGRVEQRKAEYRREGVSYYQPWVVLMSDGAPTDEWRGAARKLREMALARKAVVLSVGIGDRADLRVLTEFSNRPAKTLQGMKFREFFAWLSQSMGRVSQSIPGTKVDLPPTDGWDSI